MSDEKANCSSCRFWDCAADGVRGLCRRRSPRQDDDVGQAVWPLTHATDWCGQHEMKEDPRGPF